MDKGMSKEKINQIIDEVYERYSITAGMSTQVLSLTKDSFIHYIKTDVKFSQTWGLKIEERELSPKERVAIFMENKRTNKFEDNNCDIPTKLITITYNNETIESYE